MTLFFQGLSHALQTQGSKFFRRLGE